MREEFISVLRFLSVLQKNTEKYFNDELNAKGLGSSSQMILMKIYECEGITMQELCHLGNYHKGSVTKIIQKLSEEGYVRVEVDNKDHRYKHLYTTEKVKDSVQKIFQIREWWINEIYQDYSSEERAFLTDALEKMSLRSNEALKKVMDHYQSGED